MRVALIAGLVAALAIGIGVVVSMKTDRFLGSCRSKSVDEAEYVAGNRAILDALPIYPNARKVNSISTGQRARDACGLAEHGPPYDRYGTGDIYTLPPEGRNIVLAPWKSPVVRPRTQVPSPGQSIYVDAPTPVPSVLIYYDRELRKNGWRRYGWSGHSIYFKRGSARLGVSASLRTNDPYKRDPTHELSISRG